MVDVGCWSWCLQPEFSVLRKLYCSNSSPSRFHIQERESQFPSAFSMGLVAFRRRKSLLPRQAFFLSLAVWPRHTFLSDAFFLFRTLLVPGAFSLWKPSLTVGWCHLLWSRFSTLLWECCWWWSDNTATVYSQSLFVNPQGGWAVWRLVGLPGTPELWQEIPVLSGQTQDESPGRHWDAQAYVLCG